MKKIYLLIIILFSSFAIFSQNDKNSTNAEQFSIKSGTLLKKEFIDAGEMKGIHFKIVYFTDMISDQTKKALRLEYVYNGTYSSDTKISILDEDEIDELIKSIELMQEKIFPENALNYTEVSFKSRGGFETGCYYANDKWKTYVKLEKYDENSYVFLTKDDFVTFLLLLKNIKTKM